MAMMSDTLMILGAIFAAIYCGVLSRRLKRLANLEGEVGQSINHLSTQIEALAHSTRQAKETGHESVRRLRKETHNAEAAARHLELLIASLHSLPNGDRSRQAASPFRAKKLTEKAETV